MDQSPFREANLSSASQEIHPILWKQKVHYCIHKSTHPVYPEPNQSRSFSPSHFLKIRLSIILPFLPTSFKLSLSPQVSPPKYCTHLPSATCTAGNKYIEINKCFPKALCISLTTRTPLILTHTLWPT